MLWRILMRFASLRPTMIVLHLQTGTEAQLTVDPESWELANRVAMHCKVRKSLLVRDFLLCAFFFFFFPSPFSPLSHGFHCSYKYQPRHPSIHLQGEDVDPLIICVITRPLIHVTTPEVMAITSAAKENSCCMELRPLNEFERLRYSAQV